MMRTFNVLTVTTAAILLSTVSAAAAADAGPKFPGLANPGALSSLSIPGDREGEGITLQGREDRGQLVVTGQFASGQLAT